MRGSRYALHAVENEAPLMWRPHSIVLLFSLLALLLIAPTSRAEAERCGPNSCKAGTTCCNKGCGICAAPGEGCIALFCFWGRPRAIDANENPTTGNYDRVTVGLAVRDSQLRLNGSEVGTATGNALHLRMQHVLGQRAALRVGVTGSTLVRGREFVGNERFGWSLDVGGTYRLPPIARLLGSALTLDAEFLEGPVAGDSLAPAAFADNQAVTFAGGIVLEDLRNAIPFTGHARFVRSANDDADLSVVDVGLTFSSNLDWIYWRGGKPFPFGVRLSYGHAREVSKSDYQEHEFSGGLYYFGCDKTRIGLDFEASYQSLDENLDARSLGAMLRVDYYWDANH